MPPLYQPFGPANFFPNPLKGEVGFANPGAPPTLHTASHSALQSAWLHLGEGGECGSSAASPFAARSVGDVWAHIMHHAKRHAMR